MKIYLNMLYLFIVNTRISIILQALVLYVYNSVVLSNFISNFINMHSNYIILLYAEDITLYSVLDDAFKPAMKIGFCNFVLLGGKKVSTVDWFLRPKSTVAQWLFLKAREENKPFVEKKQSCKQLYLKSKCSLNRAINSSSFC